jgi:protein-disulfide isomerase
MLAGEPILPQSSWRLWSAANHAASRDSVMTSRRQVLLGTAALALSPLLASQDASAQAAPGVASPLGDVWLGSPDAKVTIIEYASLTCGHCANFHKDTFPALKAKYIDTGKVRFVLREFPLDPLAAAGFMLARCNGNDKYYPMTDLLFAQQKNWAFTDKPVDALSTLVKQAGFTQDSFEACLKRQDIYDAVTQVKDGGAKAGVDSTPTFFINGQKRSGALGIAEFEKIIDPLLAS